MNEDDLDPELAAYIAQVCMILSPTGNPDDLIVMDRVHIPADWIIHENVQEKGFLVSYGQHPEKEDRIYWYINFESTGTYNQ